MLDKVKEAYKQCGLEIVFTREFPEGYPDNRPVVWIGDKAEIFLAVPKEADDFDTVYVACEALAAAEGFKVEGRSSGGALVNSWVLHKAIGIVGSNARVIEILKENIAMMFSRDFPAEQVAYVLWSRMVAADVMEMLGPIRMSRPEVAEMIEKIDSKWHIPTDSRDAAAMASELPIPEPKI